MDIPESTEVDVLTSGIFGLKDLFLLGYFKPAAVQRDFEWGTVQAGQLQQDILELMAALQEQSATQGDGKTAVPGSTVPGSDAPPEEFEDSEPDEDQEVGRIDGVSELGAQAPDLIDLFFLGSIILYPGENDDYEIFDGLQRLTTLTILLSVLRDRTDDPNLKKQLHALVDDSTNKKNPPDPPRHQTVFTQICAVFG